VRVEQLFLPPSFGEAGPGRWDEPARTWKYSRTEKRRAKRLTMETTAIDVSTVNQTWIIFSSGSDWHFRKAHS
jgi:hypothetical protein